MTQTPHDTQDAPEEGVEIRNRSVRVSALRPHPRNYKRHPQEQVMRLVTSLRRFGQVRSIVVQEGSPGHYLIVAGHGLVEAARQERFKELRADVLPATWSEEQVVGYLAADNLHGLGGEDDLVELAQILEEQRASGFDLAALGTSADELNALLARLADDALKAMPNATTEDIHDPSSDTANTDDDGDASDDSASDDSADEFAGFDESLADDADYCCPKCHYAWSGDPK